jgi:hypothetical protein
MKPYLPSTMTSESSSPLATTTATATDTDTDTTPLPLDIDSIFVGKQFRAESFSQPRWWASGSCYTALVKSGSSNGNGNGGILPAGTTTTTTGDAGERRPATGGLGIASNSSATITSNRNNGVSNSKDKATSTSSTSSSSSSHHRDLIWHDVSTNTTQTYVSSDLLIPPGHDTPLTIDDYTLSSDKSRLLIFTNSRKVWRKKTRGDYWVLDITARDLRQLGVVVDCSSNNKNNNNAYKPSSLMFATFSPCGNMVAYVMMNNIYVQDVHTFQITALTHDGNNDIINGTFDWVYEEEFRLRNGFRWSPDSKSIAFWQIDQSGVRVVNLINNTDYLYPQLIPIPYPKAGEQNPSCRIGVVAVEMGRRRRGGGASSDKDSKSTDTTNTATTATKDATTTTTTAMINNRDDRRRRSSNRYSGDDEHDNYYCDDDDRTSPPPQITWIHVPGDPRHHYIASLDWIPDSNELVFQRLNRLQNTVHVVIAEPSTGHIRIAWTDRDEAWIDLQSAAWYGGEREIIYFTYSILLVHHFIFSHPCIIQNTR